MPVLSNNELLTADNYYAKFQFITLLMVGPEAILPHHAASQVPAAPVPLPFITPFLFLIAPMPFSVSAILRRKLLSLYNNGKAERVRGRRKRRNYHFLSLSGSLGLEAPGSSLKKELILRPFEKIIFYFSGILLKIAVKFAKIGLLW